MRIAEWAEARSGPEGETANGLHFTVIGKRSRLVLSDGQRSWQAPS